MMINLDTITLGTLAAFGLFMGIVFPLLFGYHNMFTWFWALIFVLSSTLLTIKIIRSYEH